MHDDAAKAPMSAFQNIFGGTSMKRRFILLAAVTAGTLASPWARADDVWPQRPITLVVPFAAGGGTDSIARDIAKQMSDQLRQPVVVENRGGGGGSMGANAVAKARPDGYTVLFATSTFATNAAFEPKLPYDPERDFAPVAMIGRGPLLLVTSKQLGAATVPQLLATARARAEGLNFCSAGPGSINHLAGELFRQQTGLAMTHVPFKGSAPASMELLAGRVDVFFATVPTILPHIKENKLNLLAVTSDKRSALFPEVPTLAETGVKGYDVTTWWGVLAPAATPPAVVQALNKAVIAAASAAPVQERLRHEGATPLSLSPAAFGQELRKELALWRGVVAKPGIQLQ